MFTWRILTYEGCDMEFLSSLAGTLKGADPLLLFVVFAICALVVIDRIVASAFRARDRSNRRGRDE